MSTGRLIGGILALAAGALSLGATFYYVAGGIGFDNPIILTNLAISIVILVGGILGILGKKVGGILALIGGALWLIGGLLVVVSDFAFYYLWPMSLFFIILNVGILYFLSLESIIAVISGIIILVSGEK